MRRRTIAILLFIAAFVTVIYLANWRESSDTDVGQGTTWLKTAS